MMRRVGRRGQTIGRQRAAPQLRGFWNDVSAMGEVQARQALRNRRARSGQQLAGLLDDILGSLGSDGSGDTNDLLTTAASVATTAASSASGSSDPLINQQNYVVNTQFAGILNNYNAGAISATAAATQILQANKAFASFTANYGARGAAGAQTVNALAQKIVTGFGPAVAQAAQTAAAANSTTAGSSTTTTTFALAGLAALAAYYGGFL